MGSPSINPDKITKPIQLLAVWLTGLVLLEGTFLTAAAKLQTPPWLPAVLVFAAIAFVPLFLILIFLLQTRFRPELQEDQFYSKYVQSAHKFKAVDLRESVESRIKIEERFNLLENNIIGVSASLNLAQAVVVMVFTGASPDSITRDWFSSYRLLNQSVEEFPSRFGCSSVESEGEFVQVVFQM